MEESKNNSYCFEKNLWGNYELLHSRRTKNNECFNGLMHLFSKIIKAEDTYIKALDLTEIKKSLKNIDTNSFIVKSFGFLVFNIQTQIEQLRTNLEIIKNSIIEHIKSSKGDEEKKELNDYNELIKSYSNYKNAKSSSKKKKENYYSSIKGLLELLNQTDKNNSFYTIKLSRAKKEVKGNLDAYKMSVDETNKLLAEFNSKQKNILKSYESMEIKESNLLIEILRVYYVQQKANNNIFFSKIEEMEKYISSLKSTMYSDIEKMTNSSTKISTYDEKKVSFIEYDLKIDMKINTVDDRKHYIEKIQEIQKLIPGVFSNIDLKLENKICDLEDSLMNHLNKDSEITDDIMNKIKEYLNDPAIHHNFLVVLSKIRSNGNFNKPENVIKNLGDIFNKILNEAEKNKNYNIAQNCLILSQTFYYQNSNNEKIYITEFIKNNEWLKKPDFWEGLIEKKIEEELNKFNNGFELMSEDTKDDRIKNKSSNLIFSQILTYGKNMTLFVSEKEIVKQTLNKLIKKYFISKDQVNIIFATVFAEEQKKEENKIDNINENKEKNEENKIDNTNENKEKNEENKIDNTNENKEKNEENKIDNINENKEKNEENKMEENQNNIINDNKIDKEEDKKNDNKEFNKEKNKEDNNDDKKDDNKTEDKEDHKKSEYVDLDGNDF